jgi:hypothetical protein
MKYTQTDSGRNHTAPHEKMDCTVRAIAVATGLDYATCHAACKHHGRRDGRRYRLTENIQEIMQELGFEICLLRRSGTVLRAISDLGHIDSGIVRVRGHAFGVRAGEVYDTSPPKARARVLQFWQVVSQN